MRATSRLALRGATLASVMVLLAIGSRMRPAAPVAPPAREARDAPRATAAAASPSGDEVALNGGAPVAGSRAAPAPVDANAILERVHFAFRREDGALRGGHSTYASSVDDRGAITVRPVVAGARRSTAHDPRPPRGAEPPAALTLQTVSVSRGSRALADEAPRVATDERAAALVHRGAVDEAARNTKDGVEQSWTFAARPDGAGDVVVRVRADGLPFVAATSGGLHFAGRDGLGVRYGQATWIDARGARTKVGVERTADGIALRVPAAVVDVSEYPAVLDPVIGPEQGIDAPVLGNSFATGHPAIGAGDGVFFVAWEEYHVEGLTTDVRGARVRASDGALLDSAGIPLGTLPDQSEHMPAVAFYNGQFTVAWTRAPRATSNAADLVVARVAAGTGAVLDPGGSVVASGVSEGILHNLALTSSGSEGLLVWTTAGSVMARRIDMTTGALLGAGPMMAPKQASGLAVDVGAAVGVSGYFVTWTESNSNATTAALRGARVAGDVMTPLAADLADTKYPLFSGVSYGAGKYAVVYAASPTASTSWETVEVSVDEGTSAPASPVVLDTTAAWAGASVTCDGASCAAFWGQSVGSTMHLVGRSLNPATGAPGALVDYGAVASYSSPSVARTSGTILTAFEGGSDYQPLVGRRIRASDLGALDAAPAVIGRGHNQEVAPALVASGSTYLLAWNDTRGDAGQVLAARIDGKGKLLDAAPIEVSPVGARYLTAIKAAAGTDQFLVVWGGADGGLVGRTVAVASGAVSAPFAVAPAGAIHGYILSAAARGATAFVTWDGPSTVTGEAGALVDLTHATAKPPVTLLSLPSNALYSFTALPTARGFDLVGTIWLYTPGQPSPNQLLQAWPVDPVSGALGAPLTLADNALIYDLLTGTTAGDRAVVAWQCGSSVCAARYDATARTLLDPSPKTFPSPTTAQYDRPTALASADDGLRAYIVWQPGSYEGAFDVVGARMRLADGAAVDATPFSIAATPADEVTPSVACIGPADCLVAYGKFDDTPAVLSQRLQYRTVTAGDIGTACGATDDCASGTCVDGVCCSTACGGGLPNDCMACNLPGHEGTCSPEPASAAIVCRPSAGACDVAESCDGVAMTCPADGFTAPGTACDDDGQPCTRDVCDGHGACTHPAGNLGVVCRPSAGVCDVAESCDGTDPTCPVDVFQSATTPCRAASCSGGVATIGASCTGTGPACPPILTQTCSPYLCGPTACQGNCGADTDCAPGSYCAAGVCTPRKGPGQGCSASDQCASGFCVDGVCCTSACGAGAADCQRCDMPGTEGACSVLPAGSRCSDDSCTGTTYWPIGVCDGVSVTCPPVTPRSCAPSACADGHCAAACVGDAQCAAGWICVDGVCVKPAADAGPPVEVPDAAPGPTPTADAGSAPAASSSATESNGGCACDVVAPRRGGPGTLGGLALVAAALLRRRGRRGGAGRSARSPHDPIP